MTPDGERTPERWEGEFYPFLAKNGIDGEEGGGSDPQAVLDDVRASTRQKARDVTELRQALWDRHADDLMEMARLLADAFAGGHKALVFGNGGSSTDARDFVADLVSPAVPGWSALPAMDLTRDGGVVTAVSNDVGFESVFVRQVIAHGEDGDVAVGFSTSGESENVLRAFTEARKRGMTTIGFAGFEGGRMADDGFLDVCVVAPSHYIPRVQEAHATGYHAVLTMVQAILSGTVPAEDDDTRSHPGEDEGAR